MKANRRSRKSTFSMGPQLCGKCDELYYCCPNDVNRFFHKVKSCFLAVIPQKDIMRSILEVVLKQTIVHETMY